MNHQEGNRTFTLFQKKMFRVKGVHLTNICGLSMKHIKEEFIALPLKIL